jgi:galactose mutarotase-like enzyme
MSTVHSEWLSLSSGELTVQIDPLGAQLSALRERSGLDLLWDGQPSVWSGRAPLLFPIVGALAGGTYRLDSQTYHLPRHGFARGKRFDVLDSNSSTALLQLTSDQSTHAVYPFRFELQITFSVREATLSVTSRVCNSGENDLVASFGYHPAFRWPLPGGAARSAHFIEFETDEPSPIRRLDADGLLTPVRHPTPVANRRLPLTDALFQDDVIIFDDIRSRSVTYGADGGPRIRVAYPDAPYLGLWSKPNAHFVCIEPWHGVADTVGFAGDFREKTGIFMLAPHTDMQAQMAITILDA